MSSGVFWTGVISRILVWLCPLFLGGRRVFITEYYVDRARKAGPNIIALSLKRAEIKAKKRNLRIVGQLSHAPNDYFYRREK